jgi:hypothetical protein
MTRAMSDRLVYLTMFEIARREIRLRMTRLAMIVDMIEHWRGRGETTLAELRQWTDIGERAAREVARAKDEAAG